MKVDKHITITKKQDEWLEEQPLNLSKFVRQKLNEEMEDED